MPLIFTKEAQGPTPIHAELEGGNGDPLVLKLQGIPVLHLSPASGAIITHSLKASEVMTLRGLGIHIQGDHLYVMA